MRFFTNQQTRLFGKYVGELFEPNEDRHQYLRRSQTSVFISSTNADSTKTFLGCPTYHFLEEKLGVHAFLDEKCVCGATHIDEALKRAASECTHALVLVSPMYRRRCDCVRELNTLMRRIKDREKLKVVPVLWNVTNVRGYAERFQRQAFIRTSRTDITAPDFLVDVLWPKLTEILNPEIGAIPREDLVEFYENATQRHCCSRPVESALGEEDLEERVHENIGDSGQVHVATKFTAKMIQFVVLAAAVFIARPNLWRNETQCVDVAEYYNFAINCTDKRQMSLASDALKTRSCLNWNARYSELCRRSFAIVQIHHDHCLDTELEKKVQLVFSANQDRYHHCNIAKRSEPKLPPCNVHKPFCTPKKLREASNELERFRCEDNCSNAFCRIPFQTLQVIHDNCLELRKMVDDLEFHNRYTTPCNEFHLCDSGGNHTHGHATTTTTTTTTKHL